MALRRVVVGLDFSDGSTAAARWVVRVLAPEAELVLVHVVDIPSPPGFLRGMLPPHDELLQTTIRGAETRLREAGDGLGARLTWTKVRVGRPADEIVAEAREMAADLIVIGEHGRRRGLWDALGGTAEQLLARSTVPVLLGRNVPDRAPRHLLVAIDDSPAAAAILDRARELASLYDARVTTFHTLPAGLYGHLRADPPGALAEKDVEQAARARTRTWLEQQLEEAGFAAGEAEVMVTFGNARQEIIAAAERLDVDLIVMGSRGMVAVGRVLLGSIASAVLRGAPCPVLVVPPAPHRE